MGSKFIAFEFFMGRRYLKSRGKRSFISLITILSAAGVTVGVMTLIIVIAVMAGFEADLKAKILGIESHALIMHYSGVLDDHEESLATIRSHPGVVSASPFIQSQVMLRSSGGASGVILRGIDFKGSGELLKKLNHDASLNDTGKGDDDARLPVIIPGRELAKNLRVKKGDSVFLVLMKGRMSPIGHVPVVKRAKVGGVFESGMYEYDSSLAYMDLPDAQKLLGMRGAVTGIGLNVQDIYKAHEIARGIRAKLGFAYWTRDWMNMNKNLFSALKLEKAVMFIILTLIVLVAAFNIASTLIMTVMEKKKDIAILKAMGASDKNIRRIFVMKGMIIGTAGTLAGVILGIVLCFLLAHYKFIDLPGDVYYITKLPVLLKVSDIIAIAAASVAVCFFSTLYPANQAARSNPVEAIRYG